MQIYANNAAKQLLLCAWMKVYPIGLINKQAPATVLLVAVLVAAILVEMWLI